MDPDADFRDSALPLVLAKKHFEEEGGIDGISSSLKLAQATIASIEVDFSRTRGRYCAAQEFMMLHEEAGVGLGPETLLKSHRIHHIGEQENRNSGGLPFLAHGLS
jgi:hypothetical protein